MILIFRKGCEALIQGKRDQCELFSLGKRHRERVRFEGWLKLKYQEIKGGDIPGRRCSTSSKAKISMTNKENKKTNLKSSETSGK